MTKYSVEVERKDSSMDRWEEEFRNDGTAHAVSHKLFITPSVNSVVVVNLDSLKTIYHKSKNALLTVNRDEQILLQTLRKYTDLKWGATKDELRDSKLSERKLNSTLEALKKKKIIFYSPQQSMWVMTKY